MIETERKFIILKPDIARLESIGGYGVSDITQTYLSSDGGVTERVRRRVYAERVEYTHTAKRRISRMSSIEDEREIDEKEYLELLSRMKAGTSPIRKTRHTLPIGTLTLEIDIYPEWERLCIMECELDSEDGEIPLPDFITVVREVTGVREYTNASMAREFPREE
ncbi:MAG: hypothetical protein IJW48_05025 [Clostridia bacterium]|nr:hypothetical protein [Clostridia bacterium]